MQMQPRASLGSQPQVVEDAIHVTPNKGVTIDLAKLRAPSVVYDADVAWIAHKPGSVSLFFGKRALDTAVGGAPELRTRLEIRYPPEQFVMHFWRNSEEFSTKLHEFVRRWKFEPVAAVDPSPWRAAKDHSEWVNFEAMAHVGSEATIDFYQMPASAVARFNQGLGSSGLNPLPIVRVHLTAFELVRLFDQAGTVAEAVKAYMPAPVVEGELVESK
jgi:hypothetical protein